MESWRAVWRKAVVQLAPFDGLVALRKALAEDSPKIIQGTTTHPPPLKAFQDWPVEASDPIGYLFWKGEDATVGNTEEFFARMCFEIDHRLGEPAVCRWFLNWYDETPRDTMRRELIPEVDLAIARKKES